MPVWTTLTIVITPLFSSDGAGGGIPPRHWPAEATAVKPGCASGSGCPAGGMDVAGGASCPAASSMAARTSGASRALTCAPPQPSQPLGDSRPPLTHFQST